MRGYVPGPCAAHRTAMGYIVVRCEDMTAPVMRGRHHGTEFVALRVRRRGGQDVFAVTAFHRKGPFWVCTGHIDDSIPHLVSDWEWLRDLLRDSHPVYALT